MVNISMNGLLSTKSYNFWVPIRKDPTMRPLCIVLRLFVTQPRFTKSIIPPENISEWIPRFLWLVRAARTASGMLPIPREETKYSNSRYSGSAIVERLIMVLHGVLICGPIFFSFAHERMTSPCCVEHFVVLVPESMKL